LDYLSSIADKNLQYSELSELTYQQCMNTSLAPVSYAKTNEEFICTMVNGRFEETRDECYRVSDLIALGVEPVFEDIVGRCSQTSNECANGLIQLGCTDSHDYGLVSDLQDVLIQSTVLSSVSVSDSILSCIMSI